MIPPFFDRNTGLAEKTAGCKEHLENSVFHF